MAAILLDTSFLVSLANIKDKHHALSVATLKHIREPLVLPVPVLPEVTYLLATRLSHHAMRQFLRSLNQSDILLESLSMRDLMRVSEILDTYGDTHLDFVDASITAIAERQDIQRILTFDRRDFSIIRPRHCDYFHILP